MKTKMTSMCRCGCEQSAEFICRGFDFDPSKPGNKGEPFVEPCCRSAADYLESGSYELNLLPFSREPIR